MSDWDDTPARPSENFKNCLAATGFIVIHYNKLYYSYIIVTIIVYKYKPSSGKTIIAIFTRPSRSVMAVTHDHFK